MTGNIFMFLFSSSHNLIFDSFNTKKSTVEASGRNTTCRCDWKCDVDINEGFQVPNVGTSQCHCNRSGTGSVACGKHWMIIYADDCCLHWQRGIYSHQAVYTCIGCCIFLFWLQYNTLPTATQLPFLNSSALSSDIQEKIPFFISDFLPWHFIHEHQPVGEQHHCVKGWGATLEIGMQLDWRSPLGCWCRPVSIKADISTAISLLSKGCRRSALSSGVVL